MENCCSLTLDTLKTCPELVASFEYTTEGEKDRNDGKYWTQPKQSFCRITQLLVRTPHSGLWLLAERSLLFSREEDKITFSSLGCANALGRYRLPLLANRLLTERERVSVGRDGIDSARVNSSCCWLPVLCSFPMIYYINWLLSGQNCLTNSVCQRKWQKDRDRSVFWQTRIIKR